MPTVLRAAVAGLCLIAAIAPAGAAHAAAERPQHDLALDAAPRTADEFGADWDDPRTAAPPIEVPPTHACTVRIVDHKFVDFTPYTGYYAPPPGCGGGSWSKVVLRLDGAVKGRQYDRLGALRIGDATIFKTSTPEPSPDGITWHVEKDVTEYAALLRSTHPIWMLIGNVVDDTYTGVLDVQVSLTFYGTDAAHPAAATAAQVLPVTGELAVPRDTERLIADVYATGSGGGCEEFWYLAAPASSGYSCAAPDGPYREVQVLLDGQVAGIAAPYPHIYTGGWSNPFLWYAQPAPRAFDVRPLQLDLTPFVGLLTDGRPHALTVRVEGVPAGESGWDTPVTVRVWRDPSGRPVRGGLVKAVLSEPDHTSTVSSDASGRRVETTGTRTLTVTGWLATSRGRVLTTVTESLTNRSTHRWGAEENPDTLAATWTDTAAVATLGTTAYPSLIRSAKRYTVDGSIAVSPENRLTTTIALLDAADEETVGAQCTHRSLRDEYRGEASWILGVPRDQRHAVGASAEHYRQSSDGGRYDKRLTSRNGYFVS